MLVVIDPGHGGIDPGAIGPAGTHEADVNLALARTICQKLKALGHKVVMTREQDKTINLYHRAHVCPRADVFVSIHCNAVEDPRASGFEIWTSPGETRADELASVIFRRIVAFSPKTRRFRSDFLDGDEDKEAEYYVLAHTPMPAVLIELAFISNSIEEQMLRDNAFLDNQATLISEGIVEWASESVT